MDFLHGTCHAGNNYDAFRDLGLNSMRLDIPYPFASPARDMSEGFEGMIRIAREYRDNGIEPLCITSGPAQVPDWEGPPGSDGYFALARETAAFAVDKLRDYVRVWESTNEMNQAPFRAPLNVEQAVRFVIESARGVKDAGADFIKTSTGFGPRPTTTEDIRLIRSVVGREIGIKAAGGIDDLDGAVRMLDAGANRIGSSYGIAIVQSVREEGEEEEGEEDTGGQEEKDPAPEAAS